MSSLVAPPPTHTKVVDLFSLWICSTDIVLADLAQLPCHVVAVSFVVMSYTWTSGALAAGNDRPGSPRVMTIAKAEAACDADQLCAGFTYHNTNKDPSPPLKEGQLGSEPTRPQPCKPEPSPQSMRDRRDLNPRVHRPVYSEVYTQYTSP